jgi:hypothetical protein
VEVNHAQVVGVLACLKDKPRVLLLDDGGMLVPAENEVDLGDAKKKKKKDSTQSKN